LEAVGGVMTKSRRWIAHQKEKTGRPLSGPREEVKDALRNSGVLGRRVERERITLPRITILEQREGEDDGESLQVPLRP
jgi:hypothetical protein